MIRFLSTLFAVAVVLGAPSVFAQIENEQIETKTMEELEDSEQPKIKMPKRKSDAQVKKESAGLPKNWDTMTEKERQEYSQGVLEDRFILTTSNFKIISLATGTQLCTMDLSIGNASSRTIQKIFIKYHWGETSTYLEFSDLKPLEIGREQISLAGSVCKRVTEGADYEVTTCHADGLTQEQCRLRVFSVK